MAARPTKRRAVPICLEIDLTACQLYTRKRTCAVQEAMSALGQKRTCAVQNVMSALPPKADICGAKSAWPSDSKGTNQGESNGEKHSHYRCDSSADRPWEGVIPAVGRAYR